MAKRCVIPVKTSSIRWCAGSHMFRHSVFAENTLAGTLSGGPLNVRYGCCFVIKRLIESVQQSENSLTYCDPTNNEAQYVPNNTEFVVGAQSIVARYQCSISCASRVTPCGHRSQRAAAERCGNEGN